MKMIARTIASLGFVAAFASVGQAQYLTDAGSPLGSGAGLSGSVTSFATTNAGITQYHSAGARPTLMALLAGGSPAPFAQMLGSAPQATALAEALGAMGAQPTAATFVAAVRAFNAYLALNSYNANPQSRGAAEAAISLLINMGAKIQ